MLQTYGEVCHDIAVWLKNTTDNKVILTPDQVFDLDKNFPALALTTLKNYMDKGCNATDVLVSDEYCAKIIGQAMGWF